MYKLLRGLNKLSFSQSRALGNKLITRSIQQCNPDEDEEIVQNILGNFVTIGINIPETKNVLTETALEKLYDCIKNFEGDDQLSAAVLHGFGGNFCSGVVESSRAAEVGQNLLMALHTLKKPIIAALEGYTRGFGLHLAIMCDMRAIEEQALVGFYEKKHRPEIPPFLYERLIYTVGLGKATELICTQNSWQGSHCLSNGLANKVVDTGCCLGQSIIWAQSITITNPLEKVIEHKSKILSTLPPKSNLGV